MSSLQYCKDSSVSLSSVVSLHLLSQATRNEVRLGSQVEATASTNNLLLEFIDFGCSVSHFFVTAAVEPFMRCCDVAAIIFVMVTLEIPSHSRCHSLNLMNRFFSLCRRPSIGKISPGTASGCLYQVEYPKKDKASPIVAAR